MPRIEADSARIHYELTGRLELPVLLLSNSLGTDLHMWDHQLEALAPHFRLLRYDSRGHGRSDAPAGPYTIERLGRDVQGLLDALGIAQVHFCGLSLGGMVGMWLAAETPQRVGRLVVANTSAYFAAPEMWRERARLVRSEGTAALREAVLARWLTPEFAARHPKTVARVVEMLLRTPAEGYAACCEAIAEMDLRETIGSIARPTLVVAAKRDPATPTQHARAIRERIAGAELVELDDAAHLSNIETPERFNEAVCGFLAGRV